MPNNKEEWEAATWILATIGDIYFLISDYQSGAINLRQAMFCPGAIGNPFLHLRLGQCEFELGNKNRAKDELTRAFMAEGKDIYEDEDPKYFKYLQECLEGL